MRRALSKISLRDSGSTSAIALPDRDPGKLVASFLRRPMTELLLDDVLPPPSARRLREPAAAVPASSRIVLRRGAVCFR